MAPTKRIITGSKLWLSALSWPLSCEPSVVARLLSISASAPLYAPICSNSNVSTSRSRDLGSALLSDSPKGQPRVRCLNISALKSWLTQWFEDCAVTLSASGSGKPVSSKCPKVRHQWLSVASLNRLPKNGVRNKRTSQYFWSALDLNQAYIKPAIIISTLSNISRA